MTGIESGGVKAYTDPLASIFSSKTNQNHHQNQGSSGVAASSGDMVSLKNFFSEMASSLRQKVDSLLDEQGGQSRSGALESVMIEMSAKVSVKSEFSAQYAASPNGNAIASYSAKHTEEASFSFKISHAQDIVAAHAGGIDGDAFGQEATSQRIVDFAMGFFPMFAKDNPDMSYEEQVEAYRELVEGAIGEGFKQAMDIFGEISNEVSAGIEETRSLVSQKLDAIFENMLDEGKGEAKSAMESGNFKGYVHDFFDNYNQERFTESTGQAA